MLANAIDEPSVLSRSVEACSSFPPDRARKEWGKGIKKERGKTSMDSDGERGGG